MRARHESCAQEKTPGLPSIAQDEVPRIPAVSLPEVYCESVDSRFTRVGGELAPKSGEAERERHDWDGRRAREEPHFLSWNGPKLDWPGYYVDYEQFINFPKQEPPFEYYLSEDGFYRDSVFTCEREDWEKGVGFHPDGTQRTLHALGDGGQPLGFPPWMLIKRVLSLLEAQFDMHGRRLWWRSVFYPPPGFSEASDSRPHAYNTALISHMRLAGLGEATTYTTERAQHLGPTLRAIAGLPLERPCFNFTGSLDRCGFSCGHDSPKHAVWWCPQRNAWIGDDCLSHGCSVCVLPHGWSLPYCSSDDARLRNQIEKAALDITQRQRALRPDARAYDSEATYEAHVNSCCSSFAKARSPVGWTCTQSKDPSASLTGWQHDVSDRKSRMVYDGFAHQTEFKLYDFDPEMTPPQGLTSTGKDGWLKMRVIEHELSGGKSSPPLSGPYLRSVAFAHALRPFGAPDDAVDDFMLTTAFAAPGYCFKCWQLGRATMTALGFRLELENATEGRVSLPGHEPGKLKARWVHNSTAKSAEKHRKARTAQLKEHVFAPYCDQKAKSDEHACAAACRRLELAWTTDVLPLPMPRLTPGVMEPEEPEGVEEACEPHDEQREREDGEQGEGHLAGSGDEEAEVS